MSSTNRGAERIALDAYYTPDDVALACVGTIARDIAGCTVLEPHAGGGAFVRVARICAASVIVNDVNEKAPALREELGEEGWSMDFLLGRFGDRAEWTIGNPPFTDAEAHVRHAIAISRVGCAFLLRLAFLEGMKRRDFWREHPAAEVHVLVSRPSFTGGATDSAAYGWFIWRRKHVGPTILRHLDWRAA